MPYSPLGQFHFTLNLGPLPEAWELQGFIQHLRCSQIIWTNLCGFSGICWIQSQLLYHLSQLLRSLVTLKSLGIATPFTTALSGWLSPVCPSGSASPTVSWLFHSTPPWVMSPTLTVGPPVQTWHRWTRV